jgi:formyl-CoA transferase
MVQDNETRLQLQRPLAGVRVLDITRFLAGPYATWVLAELGADVIKVEDPDRPDEARAVGPHFLGEQSLYFAALNSGKRSLAVRLRRPDGRDLLRRLVHNVDVVVDNHRPGVMERLGLGPGDLSQVNPKIVTCSLSGFGNSGSFSERPGYDYTIQALSGVMSMTGEPGGSPGKAGISYVDHSGGLTAALAICAALVGRGRTGEGGHVDLALFDIQMSMLSYLAAWNLNSDYVGARTPSASHPSLVPAQNFSTADGHISLFVGNDAMWTRLVKALGDPLLAQDYFKTNEGRCARSGDVVGKLSEIFAARPNAYWIELLSRHSVPVAPINGLGEALSEPHTRERGLIGEASHPVYGSYRYVRGPIPTLASQDPAAAPLLGENSEVVLLELGMSAAEVEKLVSVGAVLGASIK